MNLSGLVENSPSFFPISSLRFPFYKIPLTLTAVRPSKKNGILTGVIDTPIQQPFKPRF